MKSIITHSIAGIGLLASFSLSFATVIGTSAIEQPVNLAARSDPSRIPLGDVLVVSNHGYGIHHKIVESRPSPAGAMIWKNGSELDQNLASVFGISIEIPDTTQILAAPLTLRLKAWTPPAYSPYTKEQVLAATIWCIIRSSGSTVKNPLEIIVITENPEEKWLESKYSSKYISEYDGNDSTPTTLNVGESIIEEDVRGIAWVTFPNVKKDHSFKPMPYCMIASESSGDGDSGWHLLPVWGNGESPEHILSMIDYSVGMIYSAWSSKGISDANSFLNEGGSYSFDVTENENSVIVDLSYVRANQYALAATILGCIITTQPTADKPLIFSYRIEAAQLEAYGAFAKSAGWNVIKHVIGEKFHYELQCEFVWDPVTKKITKGSVPLMKLERPLWMIEDVDDAE